MQTESSGTRDALQVAMGRGREMLEHIGVVGFGVAHLVDAHGRTKQLVPFHNLLTDAGDLYIATKTLVGIAPAAIAAPTPANGMKLGTSATNPSKAGAGAVLSGYLTGTNVAFAATYPQVVNLGSGLGVNALYRTVFAAGVGTSASIREVALVTDQATNTLGTAAATLARALFASPIDKAALDTLTVDWAWKTLGT